MLCSVSGRTSEPVGRMAERQKGFCQAHISRQNLLSKGQKLLRGRIWTPWDQAQLLASRNLRKSFRKVTESKMAEGSSIGTNCYKHQSLKSACTGWYMVLEYIDLHHVQF